MGPADHPGQSPILKSVIWSHLQRPHSQAPGSGVGILWGRRPADHTTPVAELPHMLEGVRVTHQARAACQSCQPRLGEPHPEPAQGLLPWRPNSDEPRPRLGPRPRLWSAPLAAPGGGGAGSHALPAAQTPHRRWGPPRGRRGTAGPSEHTISPSLGSGLRAWSPVAWTPPKPVPPPHTSARSQGSRRTCRCCQWPWPCPPTAAAALRVPGPQNKLRRQQAF